MPAETSAPPAHTKFTVPRVFAESRLSKRVVSVPALAELKSLRLPEYRMPVTTVAARNAPVATPETINAVCESELDPAAGVAAGAVLGAIEAAGAVRATAGGAPATGASCKAGTVTARTVAAVGVSNVASLNSAQADAGWPPDSWHDARLSKVPRPWSILKLSSNFGHASLYLCSADNRLPSRNSDSAIAASPVAWPAAGATQAQAIAAATNEHTLTREDGLN